MPGLNIACNIGNQLGNGSGEMKFEVAEKDEVSGLANCIATEIVNEILENALDIATMRNVPGLECDTIAFSIEDGGVCPYSNQKVAALEGNIEEISEDCADIKGIIDGLSAIHISKSNINKAEEPLRLDVEMKRLLTEMMSPPYDIVNYETLARKDGVGDQPMEDFATTNVEDPELQEDDCLVDSEKIKVVEKKTRVTDLVMNSKQVLSEYLLSDESRKFQEDWEEKNEKVIQVIELDYIRPDEEISLRKRSDQLDVSPDDKDKDNSDDGQEKEKDELVLPVENDRLDNVDLNLSAKQDDIIVCEQQEAGGEIFDEVSKVEKPTTHGASTSRSSTLDTAMAKQMWEQHVRYRDGEADV
ncbi:hypothetical protein QE152_g14202 [Popillia japonica]|uniref:Uncharacterized protein n=1 Tax=Popillia japonica TaxID=7064 RepID=A0AAW1L7R6_POPJA